MSCYIPFRCPEALAQMLAEQAARRGISRSAFIIDVLQASLAPCKHEHTEYLKSVGRGRCLDCHQMLS